MSRLFGGILLAVGVLVAGASGICSLAVLASSVRGNERELGGFLNALPLVALFGGIPLGLGVLMILGGLKLIRANRD